MKTAMIQTPIVTGVQYFIHYVPKADWKKAIGFFQDTLGLSLRMDTGEDCWAEFVGGGITFALHSTDEKTTPRDTGITFAITTANCEEAAQMLKDRGVQGVTEPKSVCEDGKSFSFKDPWGNGFSCYGH